MLAHQTVLALLPMALQLAQNPLRLRTGEVGYVALIFFALGSFSLSKLTSKKQWVKVNHQLESLK